MTSSALIMMILVQGTFIAVTGYFFYKVMTTPPKAEPDSFEFNDDIPPEERQHDDS